MASKSNGRKAGAAQAAGIDRKALERAAGKIRAIMHPLRANLVKLIAREEPISVGRIQNRMQLQQSVTSMQLGVLRKAGYVTAKRNGRQVHYRINKKHFIHTMSLLKGL